MSRHTTSTARPLAEESSAEPWPRGFDRTPAMTIGQLHDRLRQEFPAITVSKIRYLEGQGLVSPQRTASGYRKYCDADVERLRYVLTRQRDDYAPLHAIREDLRALDAGHDVEPAPKARVVSADGRTVEPSRPMVSARELSDLTGVSIDALERYSAAGLLAADLGGYFPAGCVRVVTLIAQLEAQGVDLRHLRSVKRSADRDVDVIDQTLVYRHGRPNGAERERLITQGREWGELFADLHREMMRVAQARLYR